jgi:S1-C subfamily serine protease
MGDTLKQFSDALVETVAGASSSVLRVEARRRLPASGIAFSEDGVILTAHHVIEKEEEIIVGLPDGGEGTAELVGRDPSTDLAVLKGAGLRLRVPEWTVMQDLQVGHLVLALGRPGRTIRATMGVVSAFGDAWRTPAGGQIDHYLQTDVVMYPGFSGGPLVDAQGDVAGMNTSALVRGVSITVPISTAKLVVGAILEHGRVRRGFLGVSGQAVPLPGPVADQVGQEAGLLVVSVEPGSAADLGGLLLGDTILRFAGSQVRRVDDLLLALTGDRIGQEIAIQILRGGEVKQVSVIVAEKKGASERGGS